MHMLTDRSSMDVTHNVHLSASKRPAVVRREDTLGGRRLTPERNSLHEVSRGTQHTHRARFVREQVLQFLADDRVGFVHAARG